MYKDSKNLKYPLNLLEDAIGFIGVNNNGFRDENFGKRERSLEEVLAIFGIEANETFFKWLDKYIEKECGDDVKLMFDKRYKEKKSLRQIQKETGFSPAVITNRVQRFGSRFHYVAKDYREEMGIIKKK